VFTPSLSHAAAPSADLLQKLAAYSSQLESLQKHMSFVVDGKLESIDGDGHTDGTKEGEARVVSNGKKQHVIVVRYLDDGKDETRESQRKINEREEAEAKKTEEERQKDERKIPIPFLAAEQPKYVFDVVETDAHDPNRVRITFVPREPTKETVEGAIWVDATTGRPLSTGFKLSKPGMFIEYVHIQIELGAQTSAGPMVSHMTVEAAGGFLFVHKHFRGVATMHDYRVTP
jgi:hypothetical protein